MVFISLGTWQLQRKAEKEALLKTLLENPKKPAQDIDVIKGLEPFHSLYAIGHFIPGKTIFLQSKVHQGQNGVYILDLFQTQKGKYLLIQRGWSHYEVSSVPSGKLRIEGIARTPSSPTFFQPANTPPTYFWIDLSRLSQDLKIPLLPYYLVAKSSFDPHIYPTEPLPYPRNHHLSYAITWYSLAFALGIMLLWKKKLYWKKEIL